MPVCWRVRRAYQRHRKSGSDATVSTPRTLKSAGLPGHAADLLQLVHLPASSIFASHDNLGTLRTDFLCMILARRD